MWGIYGNDGAWYGGASFYGSAEDDRRALVFWTEGDIPAGGRAAVFYWTEGEIALEGRRAVFYWTEGELPEFHRAAAFYWTQGEIPESLLIDQGFGLLVGRELLLSVANARSD